jgi:hypothetical protein
MNPHALLSPNWSNSASFNDPTAVGRGLFTWCTGWTPAGSPAANLGSSTSSQNRTSSLSPGWMNLAGRLKGCNIFMKPDLKQGYHQIPMVDMILS